MSAPTLARCLHSLETVAICVTQKAQKGAARMFETVLTSIGAAVALAAAWLACRPIPQNDPFYV